jgi:hypothetical protein
MIPGSLEVEPHRTRLDSWKSIAQYLNRCVRTVQGWHLEVGLPVHHISGDSGSVYAYQDELDAWMGSRSQAKTVEPQKIQKPILVPKPLERVEPDHPHEALTVSLVSQPAKVRSAQLVALATKMWTALSHNNLKVIARHLREAIDLDPLNAAAYASLSLALIADGFMGFMSALVAYGSAEDALRRSMEIDPELPEAKCAAAWLKMVVERDWQAAGRGFDDAMSVQPRFSCNLVGRAMLHVVEGRLNRASDLLLKTAQQNPLSTPSMALYCWTKYLAGEYAHASDQIEQIRSTGRFDPELDSVDAVVSIQLDGPHASIPLIEDMVAAAPRNDLLRGALGYAYAVTGKAHKATALFDAMTNPSARLRSREPYAVALILVGLDKGEKAVQWLERSYRKGSFWSLGLRSDPILDSLKDDPHFRPFLQNASFPNPPSNDLAPKDHFSLG